MNDRPVRALFVNSGILGHATVADLLHEAMRDRPGIATTTLNLNDHLTRSDRVVRRVISYRPFASLRKPHANLDLTRWRFELNTGIHAARRMRAAERASGRFDVLHLHPQPAAYVSIRRMRATPTIVSIDATNGYARDSATPGLQKLSHLPGIVHDRAVFRAAAAIVATSKWAADDLARLYPECVPKTRVMPYPVRLDHFDREWAAQRLERGTNRTYKPRVLFMGGTFEGKGGFDLLEVWRKAGFATRASLDVVTNWPIPERCVSAGVRIHRGIEPYTADWLNVWRTADVFVLPTRVDVFGIVLQEAGAAGLPVITTNRNAAPEIVIDERTGVLIPPHDDDALSRSLGRLIDDAHLRHRMGTAARVHIARTASMETYGRDLARLILTIAPARS